MEEFFNIQKSLEEKGYHNVELIGGGMIIVASCENKPYLFDLNMEQIPETDQVKVEKISDNSYIITVNSYVTEYKIL